MTKILALFLIMLLNACAADSSQPTAQTLADAPPVTPAVQNEILSEDGRFAISVPDPWVVISSGGQFTFASSDDVMLNLPAELQEDQAFGSLFVDTAENMGVDPTQDTPAMVLERYRLSLLEQEAPPQVFQVVGFDVDGKAAASVQATYDNSDQYIIVIALDNAQYGFININTAQGAAWRFEEIARAIAASLRVVG